MIATIFDYGAGNLHSLAKALAATGSPFASRPIRRVPWTPDLLVLPGVGAFPSAAAQLSSSATRSRAPCSRGLPSLGICLGMQLLFARATRARAGLGVFDGAVDATCREAPAADRLEHDRRRARSGSGAVGLTIAYYANSFACRPDDPPRLRLDDARGRSLSRRRATRTRFAACSFTRRRARPPASRCCAR